MGRYLMQELVRMQQLILNNKIIIDELYEEMQRLKSF